MAGALAVAVGIGRRRRAEPLRLRVVALEVAGRDVRRREVDRRGEQLEHQLARVAHALGVGLHLHPVLGLARAGGSEHARALDLDDADAARVRGLERVAVAERRRVDPEPAAGAEDRLALEDAHRLPVDLELDHAPRREQQLRHAKTPAAARSRTRSRSTPSGRAADRRVAHALPHLGDHRQLALRRRRSSCRRRAARATPAGAPCRRGRARTGRTTRCGRTPRSASAAAAGRRSRRARARRPSRASSSPRARPRT